MVDHSLAIQSFQSRIALTGLREEAPRLGAEVSRAVREMLPEAVGRALEPLLGSRGGVLRIDRIALKLRLNKGGLSAALLAESLARQIAEAVAQRASGSVATPRAGPGFAFWPDHASYAASYIALRLGLAPAPAWAFPDLKALVHLAPHEAALELIAARPAILSALARHLRPGAATTLATRLSEATASLLVERLADAPLTSLADTALEDIAAMLAAMPVDPYAGPGVAVVAAAVAWLATQPAQDADNVRRVVLLAQVAAALAAIKAVAVGEWGQPPREADLRPEAFPHLPDPARRLAQAALTPLTAEATTRAALAEVLGATSSPAAAADPAAPRQAAETAVARSISSLMAGIGLLIPAALTHDLPELLSPAALHRTLVAAAGRDVEPMVRLDPMLAALAPFDPRGPSAVFPPVPDALRAAVPAALRDGEAEAEGAAGWAACLIHAFAADLAGFETSTLPYLRRQFLWRPGTLHIADDRLTLVLDPMPLGIVLRLRGPHGWTGRLPYAHGALLRIDVAEG